MTSPASERAGGTFTDVVAHDAASGRTWSGKVPTVTAHPAAGVVSGIAAVVGGERARSTERVAEEPDEAFHVHEGGPTVLTVFVNRNRGTVLQVEEVVGRIAQDLVRAWGTTKE